MNKKTTYRNFFEIITSNFLSEYSVSNNQITHEIDADKFFSYSNIYQDNTVRINHQYPYSVVTTIMNEKYFQNHLCCSQYIFNPIH